MVGTDLTERNPALEPFDALVGTWDTEAHAPDARRSRLGLVVVRMAVRRPVHRRALPQRPRVLPRRGEKNRASTSDSPPTCARHLRGRLRAGPGARRVEGRS